MLKTYFVDTETCGLHGVPVLLQYAVDNDSVRVVELWRASVASVMSCIEEMTENRVVAHNLRFDWFMLSKFYNILRQVPDNPHNVCLLDYPVSQVAGWEYETRNGLCLKPASAIDTLIFAQRGEAQAAVMDSKPIYVRRVYRPMAEAVRHELELKTDLPWILFANRQDPDAPKWKIVERDDDETGERDPLWVDLKLSFAPSNGLKPLCKFLLGYEPPASYDEIALDEKYNPIEEGFAPFASLLSSKEEGWLYNGKPTWPALIRHHVEHWSNDEDAREYAVADISMLRQLYQYLGSPTEDQDSMLAAQVASVRLRGFAVNLEGMETERVKSQKIIDTAQLNVNSPLQVRAFIAEAMDPMEQMIVANGCDKNVIKDIRKEFTLEEEEPCYCAGGWVNTNDEELGQELAKCIRCDGRGVVGPGPMPVALRADHVEEIRQQIKRVELYDKILLAKRAYPDFNVIGAKSGRMSGASNLNFQGVVSGEDVRSLFTFADEDWILSGGDYDSQELAILATTSNDLDLLNDIKGGKSLHGLMAAELFDTTYEEIMENKSNDPERRYDRAKAAVYLMAYGGTVETMAKNVDVPLEVCQKGFNNFLNKYANMGVARRAVTDRFTALKREGEGFKFEIPEEPYVESIYGFRRYFDNEYAILRAIYTLASNMPPNLRNAGQSEFGRAMMIQRTEGRVQTVGGSISSALYGAAHSIQNRIIRAAMNHLIQSVGRTLTLGLQYNIWKSQPQGIHPYRLCVMGIHDESVVVGEPQTMPEIRNTVQETLRTQCERIPLIAMGWATGLNHWFHLKKANPENCEDFVPCGFAEEA